MTDARAAEVLGQLAAEGVSPWLSGPGPALPDAAALAATVRQGFRGAALPAGTPAGAVRIVCDVLRAVHDGGGHGDGWVSVGLPMPAGRGARALVSAARALYGAVDRPNLLIGVPATPAGVEAAGACLAEGISVESTGVVTAARAERVLDAQLAGLERAMVSGEDLAGLLAAMSCALGPLDDEVNAALAARRSAGGESGEGGRRGGDGGTDGPTEGTEAAEATAERLRDAAGLSTARVLHRLREERLGDDWWRVLRAAGAGPPLLVWRDSSARHVMDVVGWNTGHVLTESVVAEVAASAGGGPRGDTLMAGWEEARAVLRELRDLGVLPGDF
ncbi:transaldolase family protein [Streptomyces sp. NPDC059009]|uniref:transaldolase family protein n=1 Tax=Streptomyces sp. NPDC059009 TaxID=3346694 RepID=UPI0036B1EFD9